MKKIFLCTVLIAMNTLLYSQGSIASKPNIIIIYADDLGYGDLGCYGADKVKTPNIDRLAKNGIRFTDAHCSAATCTPSRFSMLTGSYAFRNNAAILPGDAPLLIRPGTPTLPARLQEAGYTTGVVGKWHLGLGNGTINWNGDIRPGPLELGFDYSFLIPATLDRVPCVFVENHNVFNLDTSDPILVNYEHKIGNEPTGLEHPELLKVKADTQHSNTIINGISRIGYTSGGRSAWWKDEEIANVLINKTRDFLTRNKKKPFFLYLSYTDIHVPRAPHPMFKGATTMGSRGDDIVQMDWTTGEIIKELEKLGLSENTLLVFTSDNGGILNDGYDDQSEKMAGTHRPSGPFRGGKYSAYEGGTRVPTIVYWPSKVKPGVSHALINQVDFYASFVALTGQSLGNNEAPDSFNMLAALLGRSSSGRKLMVEEAFTLALRNGAWKYIAAQTKTVPPWLKDKDVETGLSSTAQLYHLTHDTAEKNNLLQKFSSEAGKLGRLLKNLEAQGTRPGYKNNGSK
ncbi:MAG: arylsulfatase [Chitinophagaceae bacterium]